MKKNVADIIQISIFCGIVLFFAIGTWMAPASSVSSDENRSLAKLPKLHLKHLDEFTSSFEAFLNDRMAARTYLVKSRNWLKYTAWGVSGSQSVAIGKQGWLYFLGDGSAPVIRHEKPFSEHDLQCWQTTLEQRTAWLAKHNIKYVFVVAPDKDTIYPEFLPGAWQPIRPQSRLDQLTARMKQNHSVAFLNTAEVLRQSKQSADQRYKKDLYYKTDTHWNDLGAFIAYRQLASTLALWFPLVKPLDDLAVQYSTTCYATGDCSKLLGLLGWLKEESPSIRAGKSLATADSAFESSKKPNKALVFHDSFGDGLKPFLKEHFATVEYHKQDEPWLDLEEIARQKPDVVIQEMVERHVAQFIPSTSDWRIWAINTIAKENQSVHSTVSVPARESVTWLNVLPNTAEVTARRLQESRLNGCTIKPTTCRVWTESGDSVNFDSKTAAYCDWYLLKSGEQGNPLRDKQSEQNYQELQRFIREGGQFILAASQNQADGTQLQLFRRK